MFQYPLRVLGCEKHASYRLNSDIVTFQYPLRVLGCEKRNLLPDPCSCFGFSTLCGFLAVRSMTARRGLSG